MTKIKTTLRSLLPVLLLALAVMPTAQAIDFDDVRDFEEVFVISAEAPGRDRVVVRWAIADGYYLYNNKFLRFRSATEGVVLGEPEVPPGKIGFDELLGEDVEKYYDELVVTVPLASVAPGVDALELNVRSQGCLEDELCYPPAPRSCESRCRRPPVRTAWSRRRIACYPATSRPRWAPRRRSSTSRSASTRRPPWCALPRSPVTTCTATSSNSAFPAPKGSASARWSCPTA